MKILENKIRGEIQILSQDEQFVVNGLLTGFTRKKNTEQIDENSKERPVEDSKKSLGQAKEDINGDQVLQQYFNISGRISKCQNTMQEQII